MSQQTPSAAVQAAQNAVPGQQANTIPQRLQNANTSRITVQSSFQNPQEWLRIKSLLDRTSGIERVNILSIKPQSAMISVEISRSLNDVRRNLQNHNLNLNQTGGSSFSLSFG
jgi:hypothetical protein